MSVVIYGLWSPETGNLRYIGKTINLKRRLLRHLGDAKKTGRRPPVSCWIKHLLDCDLSPLCDILEECSDENWREIERTWIIEAQMHGLNLLNYNPGGEGFEGGGHQSLTHRMHVKEALMGHSVSSETREKLRVANLGKHHSETAKMKVSRAFKGKKLTEEHREKISHALLGKKKSKLHLEHLRQSRIEHGTKPCSETRAIAISRALTEKYSDGAFHEEKRAAALKGWETRRRNRKCQ